MKKIMFVTGFHRAGTHSQAENIAKENDLPCIFEDYIQWDSMRIVRKMLLEDKLPNGFVLQCPGLAHNVVELSTMGTVYWCTRNETDIVASMTNGSFNETTWHLMKGLHREYPSDPIWDSLEYDGSLDIYDNFPRYNALFVKVKQYFFYKYFASCCTKLALEDQPFYDAQLALSLKKPLKERILKDIESICICENS